MNKNGNLAFVQFRNPKAALGNGRISARPGAHS
jgi:hypothetical protein